MVVNVRFLLPSSATNNGIDQHQLIIVYRGTKPWSVWAGLLSRLSFQNLTSLLDNVSFWGWGRICRGRVAWWWWCALFPKLGDSSHLWASRNTRILQKPLGKVWHRRIESKLVYNIKKKNSKYNKNFIEQLYSNVTSVGYFTGFLKTGRLLPKTLPWVVVPLYAWMCVHVCVPVLKIFF